MAYAYVLPKDRKHGKLSPHAVPGIFIGMGYYDGHPIQEKGGYKLLTALDNPKSVVCSRDVVFLEDKFTLPSHGEGETIKSHHEEEESDEEEEPVGSKNELQENLVVELPISGEDSNLVVELPGSGDHSPVDSGEQSSGEDDFDTYEDARSEPEEEPQQLSVHRLRSGKVWKNAFLTFPGPPLNVALNDPEWIAAMKKEDQQMKDMGVYELVE